MLLLYDNILWSSVSLLFFDRSTWVDWTRQQRIPAQREAKLCILVAGGCHPDVPRVPGQMPETAQTPRELPTSKEDQYSIQFFCQCHPVSMATTVMGSPRFDYSRILSLRSQFRFHSYWSLTCVDFCVVLSLPTTSPGKFGIQRIALQDNELDRYTIYLCSKLTLGLLAIGHSIWLEIMIWSVL